MLCVKSLNFATLQVDSREGCLAPCCPVFLAPLFPSDFLQNTSCPEIYCTTLKVTQPSHTTYYKLSFQNLITL